MPSNLNLFTVTQKVINKVSELRSLQHTTQTPLFISLYDSSPLKEKEKVLQLIDSFNRQGVIEWIKKNRKNLLSFNTHQELRAKCRWLGIKYYIYMDKSQMIEAIKDATTRTKS